MEGMHFSDGIILFEDEFRTPVISVTPPGGVELGHSHEIEMLQPHLVLEIGHRHEIEKHC